MTTPVLSFSLEVPRADNKVELSVGTSDRVTDVTKTKHVHFAEDIVYLIPNDQDDATSAPVIEQKINASFLIDLLAQPAIAAAAGVFFLATLLCIGITLAGLFPLVSLGLAVSATSLLVGASLFGGHVYAVKSLAVENQENQPAPI